MQALYRRYRPDSFEKVYGQEHITEILKNQVISNNISHAYIFSGSRGTGKTSCAKIFARAINCLNPQDGNPCNQCENCLSSLNEDTLDIVEMDAASNRRIDDIRELRDRVIYPPSKLKYKVYIIDEAHMITNDAFNALLKIMEEPPKHLVFILATTEIDKIPTTIQSRCQRYEFKSITRDDIVSNIKYILKDLGREMDDDAISLIATRADGAMRDGLSLLDQILSVKNENISKKDVEDVLGIVSSEGLFDLVDSIIEKSPGKTLTAIKNISENKPVLNVMEDLAEHYRHLILSKLGLDAMRDRKIDYEKAYKKQAEKISESQLVESINLILDYEKKLKVSDEPRILLEMLALRLIDYVDYDDLLSRIKVLEKRLDDLEKNPRTFQNLEIDNSYPVEEKIPRQDIREENTKEEIEEENLLQDRGNNDIIKNNDKNLDIVSEENPDDKKRSDLDKNSLISKIEGKVPANILDMLKKSEFRKEGKSLEIISDTASLFALRAFKNTLELIAKEDGLDRIDLLDIDDRKSESSNKIESLKRIFGDNIEIEGE